MKSMEVKTVLELLRPLRCARGLSDGALRALADVSIRKKIPANQNLWNMGDPGEFVGVILQGFFEINRLSSSGTQTCMGVFGPGDVIGMSAVVQKISYPATAKAFSKNAEVLKMYLRPVIQSKAQPVAQEISEWLREMLLVHEQILRDKLDILSAGNVEQKVFELLQQFSRRFGIKKSRSASLLPLALSKTQIARLIEARVETVIRLMGVWKKAKLVSFSRDGIEISDWEDLEKEINRGDE